MMTDRPNRRNLVADLNRGQAAGSQVPPDLALQPLEQLRPVPPLTHALQAVHQVGKGFRKVRPQLQGALVGGDGHVLPGCVLVG